MMGEGEAERRISVVTCPECGWYEPVAIPDAPGRYVHKCPGCGIRLRPNLGECCVFCVYGNVRCPDGEADGG